MFCIGILRRSMGISVCSVYRCIPQHMYCISVAVYQCIPQHKYCYMLCISVLRLSISISVYAVYRCIDSVQAIYKPRLPPPLFLPLQPYNIHLGFNKYIRIHTDTYLITMISLDY